MTVFIAPDGSPIEIAPGRGDLRRSSVGPRRDLGARTLIGGKTVSYAELFATQPWIASAVMRMLTWATRVPLKCYRRLGDDSREQLRPDDHAAARLIYRPWLGNERGPANQARLIQALLGPLLVHGNGVVEIEVVGGEEWLRPLDWRTITPIGATSGTEVVGWRVQENPGEPRDVPMSRSLHLAWWSPLGPLGVSPLEQLGVTLRIEDAAQRYQQSLFARGARPPSAITASEQFLTLERGDRQELIERLREDVEEIYAGPDRAGKPAVLPPGLDWKPVGHTAVEAALIDQRKVAREEVAAVYQIPAPMMGILDKAHYGNVQTLREMAYTDALGPPLVLVEQTLTAVIARDYFGEDDIYYEFDFGPVLRGDRLKEINAFRLGIGSGVYTPNEARRALNLPASDADGANDLWMPTNNLTRLGAEPEEPPGDEDEEASDQGRRLEAT